MWLHNFSSVFLLTVCIKQAKDQSEYRFVAQMLADDKDNLLKSKYFKRVLVSYIEYCSQAQMHVIARTIQIVDYLPEYLNDKFASFIILMFLKRSYDPVVNKMSDSIQYSLKTMLRKKHFKFVMMKAIQSKQANLLGRLNKALFDVHASAVKSLRLYNQGYFYFYFYSVFATLEARPAGEQVCLLKRLEATFAISEELNSSLRGSEKTFTTEQTKQSI